jgi:HlyD family secretion protein
VRRYHLLFIPILFSLGCNKSSSPGQATVAESATVRVKVSKPKQQPLNWIIEQPGTVEPLEVTPIVAKLPGYIKEIAPDKAALKAGTKFPGGQPVVIDIGSEVEAGQLLATLDIPELEADFLEKKAMLERSQAEKIQADKELIVAVSQVTISETMVDEAIAGVARADADVVRWKAELDQVNTQISGGVGEIQSRNVVTKSWEAAKAAKMETEAKVATAKASVLERKAKKDKAAADVETAKTRVLVARADVEKVNALVSYTQVTAPFAGIVTARNVHTRHFTQPSVGSQNPILFTVARVDVLRVFVDIPEDSADKADPGAQVVIRVPSLGGREYSLTVTRTTKVLNPNSRTMRVEIDIDNVDRALKPGTYVVAKVFASTNNSMLIPTDCVLAADETHYIYLVEGGKAVKYRAQLGHTGNGVIEVFGRRKALSTAGPWEKFNGTEQVVTGNLGALADGIPVVVE